MYHISYIGLHPVTVCDVPVLGLDRSIMTTITQLQHGHALNKSRDYLRYNGHYLQSVQSLHREGTSNIECARATQPIVTKILFRLTVINKILKI